MLARVKRCVVLWLQEMIPSSTPTMGTRNSAVRLNPLPRRNRPSAWMPSALGSCHRPRSRKGLRRRQRLHQWMRRRKLCRFPRSLSPRTLKNTLILNLLRTRKNPPEDSRQSWMKRCPIPCPRVNFWFEALRTRLVRQSMIRSFSLCVRSLLNLTWMRRLRAFLEARQSLAMKLRLVRA